MLLIVLWLQHLSRTVLPLPKFSSVKDFTSWGNTMSVAPHQSTNPVKHSAAVCPKRWSNWCNHVPSLLQEIRLHSRHPLAMLMSQKTTVALIFWDGNLCKHYLDFPCKRRLFFSKSHESSDTVVKKTVGLIRDFSLNSFEVPSLSFALIHCVHNAHHLRHTVLLLLLLLLLLLEQRCLFL